MLVHYSHLSVQFPYIFSFDTIIFFNCLDFSLAFILFPFLCVFIISIQSCSNDGI